MYLLYFSTTMCIVFNHHTLFTISQLGSWGVLFCYSSFLPLISHYVSDGHVKGREYMFPLFSVGLTPVGLFVGRPGQVEVPPLPMRPPVSYLLVNGQSWAILPLISTPTSELLLQYV